MQVEYFAVFMKSTGKQTYASVDGHRTMIFISKLSNVTLNLPQDGLILFCNHFSPCLANSSLRPHFCPLAASRIF